MFRLKGRDGMFLDPLQLVGIGTGLILAGEAFALLAGMYLLSGGNNPWLSTKNDLLLVLDLIVGLGLLGLVLIQRTPAGAGALWVLVGVGLVSHLYRDWEYLSGVDKAFCANMPLFVVNNLKIVGLVVILALLWGQSPGGRT